MKKNLAKSAAIIALIGACLGSDTTGAYTFGNKDVYAATSEDVTTTQEKNIKKLCKNFTDFIGVELTDETSGTYIKVGKSNTWEFQKWSTEDTIYEPNMVIPLWYMNIKNASKKVFDIDDFHVQNKLGDWGEVAPYLSLNSISKISSKKYKAVFAVKWRDSVSQTSKKTGSATFTLKKKKGTYYGFIVKSVKIKKTSDNIK